MNATLKTQWIDALRSGRYVQGRFCLRSLDDTYCCLGVLADVAGAQWSLPSRREFSGYFAIFADDPLESLPNFCQLPAAVVGLSCDVQSVLIALNDQAQHTFSEIAAWIDEHIPAEATEGA